MKQGSDTETRTPASDLRASIDQRIAHLNPGQQLTRERRGHYIDWCRIHLEKVAAEAEAAIAAERKAALEAVRYRLTFDGEPLHGVPDFVIEIIDSELAR